MPDAPAIQSADEFHLSAEMRQTIVDHAVRDAPRECCGIVAGRDGLPIRVFETRNIAKGNRLYEIDPAQLIHLEFHELPEQEAEIIAIYHSHPESAAYPSATDVALAFWPDAVYLICSLTDLDGPVVRGFRIRDETIHEVTLSP